MLEQWPLVTIIVYHDTIPWLYVASVACNLCPFSHAICCIAYILGEVLVMYGLVSDMSGEGKLMS